MTQASTTFTQHHQDRALQAQAGEASAIRRQAELLALEAIDSLRQVAPEVAPVFETGGTRELVIEQYERILTNGDVRWEGSL